MWLKAVKRDNRIILSVRKAWAGEQAIDDETASQETSRVFVTIGRDPSSQRILPEGLDVALPVTKGPAQPLSKRAQLSLDMEVAALNLQLAKRQLSDLQQASCLGQKRKAT